MKLRDFIRQNQEDLSAIILERVANIPLNRDGKVTQAEIENWVKNDQELGNLARSAGVDV